MIGDRCRTEGLRCLRSVTLNNHHILLVEDDVSARAATALVLEFQGYKVVTMENGQQALDYLRSGQKPSVILLDLMMPVLDGWEFRALQRQDPSLAAIPVIVLTADGTPNRQLETLAGAAGYLKKPVDIDELLSSVQRYC